VKFADYSPTLADIKNTSIVFYDNQLSQVYKTIDHFKKVFPKTIVLKNETEYFEFIKTNPIQILLLNLDVSPMDGIAIMKETLQLINDVRPFVIIYSDKQDDFLQELAYNNGADSFINYHQSPVLLELLVKSLIKRLKLKQPSLSHSNELVIDEEEYIVLKQGNKIELPKKEFKMLVFLQKNAHKFFSKKELAIELWNDETVANKRTIDVHIYNIRQVFGKNVITSQKGKGYRINKKYFS